MKKNDFTMEPMDERQRLITLKAVAWGFAFLILCLLAATIYQVVSTGDVGWELFGIIGASAVILIARRMMGDVEQPLDYRNRPLPTGSSKADRQARIKNYATESTIFSLGWAVMDVLLIGFGSEAGTEFDLAQMIFPSLSRGATIAVTAVITFVTMFAISFLLDYLVGESKVRRYNRMLEQLDQDDDE